MKAVKLLLLLLFLSGIVKAQTITVYPGPYTPMTSRGYQFKSAKIDSSLWVLKPARFDDSVSFAGKTYVPMAGSGDSSNQAASTKWVLQNVTGGGGGGGTDTVITKFPLYTITGGTHDSIAVYGVDSSVQAVTAVNDSLLRFTRFDGTTFDVPVLGKANGGGVDSLAQLTDVSLTSLGDNNVLIYDSVAGKWKNEPSINADGSGAVQGTVLTKMDTGYVFLPVFLEYEFAATYGQTTYTNSLLLGRHIRVWREGFLQTSTQAVLSGSTITFSPALAANETIYIEANLKETW